MPQEFKAYFVKVEVIDVLPLTAGAVLPIVLKKLMNFKLIFKTLLMIVVLGSLVLLGVYNTNPVSLALPPILPRLLPRDLRGPAALMYYCFFGIGFLVGTLMMAGGKKGAGTASKGSQQRQ